jgi:hypothetical protein
MADNNFLANHVVAKNTAKNNANPANKSDCHCCDGVDAVTPKRIHNPPGLDNLNYRVGHYADFVESMQARLSSADHPALAALTTRASDDFSTALSDAMACSLEVLSFYTERYAQEHYLRTANDRLSVGEMARLIGYQLAPGVAAGTHLAFTLQSAPGAPVEPIDIPIGTRVQSVPGQNEQAQSFETVEVISARAQWNAMPVQTSIAWQPAAGDTELWLEGLATLLQPGDAILIVGSDRMINIESECWDVRVLAGVDTDTDKLLTRVSWKDPLGSHFSDSSSAVLGVEVHALRQRTALFGHNAPDPNLFGNDDSNIAVRINTNNTYNWTWYNFALYPHNLDLDTDNAKITVGSWMALVSTGLNQNQTEWIRYTDLYRCNKVSHLSRNDFALSAKITRISPDTTKNLSSSRYPLRDTQVLVQSESLSTVARPMIHPVHGDELTLGVLAQDLVPGQAIALAGPRQRIAITAGVTGLTLALEQGGSSSLSEGDELFMGGPAERRKGSAWVALEAQALLTQIGSAHTHLRFVLIDRDGQSGTLEARGDQVQLAASSEGDKILREVVIIAKGNDAVVSDRDYTSIKLSTALVNVYERAGLRVNANVAAATHGETVESILGGGDGSSANQTFTLNQSPLTYVSADNTSGRASTLELRVNDVRWDEVPTLFSNRTLASKAQTNKTQARVYSTSQDDSGVTAVQFGDGIEGARLPGGESNVRVKYRKGMGVGGNVGAGKLTTLLSRPLGVSDVTNPEPAGGAQDPETLAGARDNAPLTVLTLDRAVSIDDYANFARAFAGIDKAHALWVPAGPARGVFLTIAGIDGAAVGESGTTFNSLFKALTRYGDPLLTLRISNYNDARFRCRISIKSLAEYEMDTVLENVDDTLRDHFNFARRNFGQTVSVDEVAAVAQSIAGVAAVHVTRLYRVGDAPDVTPHLFARLPAVSLTGLPNAAELLTLAHDGVELEILP